MAAIDGIDITSLLFQEGTVPATPASTKWKVYFKTDGLYVVDDAGTETGPLGTGGGGGAATAAGCRLTKSANQSIGSNATAAVTFDGEAFDSDAFHDNATNNSRITIPSGKGGQYLVGGGLQWDEGSTGAFVYLRVNGTTSIPGGERGTEESHHIQSLLSLTAGDYVELVVTSLTGATRTVRGGHASPYVNASFWATHVGS